MSEIKEVQVMALWAEEGSTLMAPMTIRVQQGVDTVIVFIGTPSQGEILSQTFALETSPPPIEIESDPEVLRRVADEIERIDL